MTPKGMITVLALLILSLPLSAQVNILGFRWENPLPYQETPAGLVSLRAKDCGLCHQEIYREWQLSTHAHALSDRQYQAELHKAPEVAWLCLNCHTPLINQRSEYAIAVRDRDPHQPIMRANKRYDAALEAEAVTCAVCHVRDGVILGPYGDSVAPHPVRHSPNLLTEKACTNCHQATAAYSGTLVCTFDTGKEWAAGPYAKKGQPCSHCHMPAIDRPITPGGPVRHSRRHYFLGSMIPKEVLGSLNGSPLNPRYLYSSGLEVTLSSVRRRPAGTVVTLKLKNARAGHLLPTGDPERHILVEVRLGNSEPQTLRIGQQWEWWPKAKKIADNRLRPLEERVETLHFPASPNSHTLEVKVINVRISKEAARFHGLEKSYPRAVVVQRLTFPIPNRGRR